MLSADLSQDKMLDVTQKIQLNVWQIIIRATFYYIFYPVKFPNLLLAKSSLLKALMLKIMFSVYY